MAKSYRAYAERGSEKMSDSLRAALEDGRTVSAQEYLEALDMRSVYNAVLDETFNSVDAIVTYAAPGAAPAGLESTGSPVFNGLWTLCGLPALTLPLLASGEGLPIGVQLIGRRHEDGRLLRTAAWLVRHLRDQQAMNQNQLETADD